MYLSAVVHLIATNCIICSVNYSLKWLLRCKDKMSKTNYVMIDKYNLISKKWYMAELMDAFCRTVHPIRSLEERDVAQWLERRALPMSLPAVRFRTSLGAGFSCFSPSQYWDIISMSFPLARHFTLECFTWLRGKWVLRRPEMVMCTISS